MNYDFADHKEGQQICLNIALCGFILYFAGCAFYFLWPQESLITFAFLDTIIGACLIIAGLTSYMKYKWYSKNKLIGALRYIYMPIAFIMSTLCLTVFFCFIK
jgi:hypothetical protein